MTEKLIIFDTTLRDGEQSPGASMTRDEKLRIARLLEKLRVDVIEAGFAASSNGDFEAVRMIASAVRETGISPAPPRRWPRRSQLESIPSSPRALCTWRRNCG